MVRVGFVGRGDQARRLHRSAVELGIELVVFTAIPTDSSGLGAAPDRNIIEDLVALTETCAIVTVAHDQILHPQLLALEAAGRTLRPNSSTVQLANDPISTRDLLQTCGFEVAAFEKITAGDSASVVRFAERHGWPVRLTAPGWCRTGPTSTSFKPAPTSSGSGRTQPCSAGCSKPARPPPQNSP